MTSPPEHLVVARILGPWGNKGEVKAEVVTDFPERLDPGKRVYLDGETVAIEDSRFHGGHLVLKLAGIDTIAQAREINFHELTVPASELPTLPPGSYYHHQLIGLKVTTTAGDCLGAIADVFSTAGNDVYVVRGDKGEILIPAIEDVVKSIDLDKGEMLIEAIEGLL